MPSLGSTALLGKPPRLEILSLHPFLLGLHAVLALYAVNANRLPFEDTFPLLAFVTVAIGAILACAVMLTRDLVRSALLTSIIAGAVLHYRTLFKLTASLLDPPTAAAFFPLIWFAVGAALLLWVARTRIDLRPVATALSVAVFVMVVLAGHQVGRFKLTDADGLSAEIMDHVATPPQAPTDVSGPRRDIYYLIFDRYASADILRDVYGFDNSGFLEELRSLGFYVAADSASNYQRTAHSLASSLSLGYLDPLTDLVGAESRSWLPLYAMLQDHAVGRFLRQRGYEFVQIGSWWDPTRDNPNADRIINWHAMPQLQRIFLMQTAIGPLSHGAGLRLFDDRADQCERIRREFDELAQLGREPQPKFVFAHFLVPHPPFVFDADGNCLSLKTVTNRSRVENYTDQVRFANKRILEAVRTILATSKTDPIIILQADEGPWPLPYAGDERFLGTDTSSVDWTRASRAELREKMRILNALYLPGPDGAPLYPNMTPVNTFRIVFNRYFGTDLPLLPDENYVFVNNRHLYKFQSVTSQVQ